MAHIGFFAVDIVRVGVCLAVASRERPETLLVIPTLCNVIRDVVVSGCTGKILTVSIGKPTDIKASMPKVALAGASTEHERD